MNLAKRSITSVAWNIPANIISIIILAVRGIILSRWLPVEVFGIYSFASAFILLTFLIADFGTGAAFIHRAPETENEQDAASVQFTLKLIFGTIWAILMSLVTYLYAQDMMRTALFALVALGWVGNLVNTPKVILIRRVQHRKFALIQVGDAVLTTTVALTFAYNGATIGALIAIDATALFVRFVLFYVWRPVWRPRLKLSKPIITYFLNFGSKAMLGEFLVQAIDRVDDLWVGYFLGAQPLGFYSRAFTFAAYPRRLLAASVNSVTEGTYAELKGLRSQLSQAFFNVNALLIRTGFFTAGLLNLLAPEFILLLLGEKWLPMLIPFRLMLLFAMLDPIRASTAALFTAIGQPERVAKIRFLQLLLLITGLFVLGGLWGVNGAALALDVMLLAAISALFWRAKGYIDFSLRRLFLAPTVCLLVGYGVTWLALQQVGQVSLWITAVLKTGLFTLIYGVSLFMLERKYLIKVGLEIAGHIFGEESKPMKSIRRLAGKLAGR